MNEELDIMKMPKSEFTERCKKWIETFNDGKTVDLEEGELCPIDVYIRSHGGCGKDLLPSITECPFCGEACCPNCLNHNVSQLSRVTGYMSAVDGWNDGKKQELKDRIHTNMSGTGDR